MNTELRADRRLPTHHRESSMLSWTLVVGFSLLTGLAILLWAKYDGTTQLLKVKERQLIAAEYARLQRMKEADEQLQHEMAIRPTATAENANLLTAERVDSGRSTGPSAMDNMSAALRIYDSIEANRHKRVAPVETAPTRSNGKEPALCHALRSERDSIEAQQRRGYYKDQHYDNRLRNIWKTMVQMKCDMSRYPAR